MAGLRASSCKLRYIINICRGVSVFALVSFVFILIFCPTYPVSIGLVSKLLLSVVFRVYLSVRSFFFLVGDSGNDLGLSGVHPLASAGHYVLASGSVEAARVFGGFPAYCRITGC